jgi:hypothetical protein
MSNGGSWGLPGRRLLNNDEVSLGMLLITAPSAGTALGDRPPLFGATCRERTLIYRILNTKIMSAGWKSEHVPSLG